MKTKRNLLSLYPKPRENGIFFSMSSIPEFQEFFNKLNIISPSDFHNIDMQYLLNKSGLKTVSTLLEYFIDGFIIDDDGDYAIVKPYRRVTWDYVMLQVDQAVINDVLRIQYLPKWDRLAKTLELNYNPLNPYQMAIDEIVNDTLNSTTNRENNSNSENNFTNTNDSNDSSSSATYGFNSTTPTPTDEAEGHSTGSQTGNSTSTNRNTSNDNYDRTNTTNRNLTRSGNIGNKSAMQLIEEERELLKWQILEQIYLDLDEVLTRSSYN